MVVKQYSASLSFNSRLSFLHEEVKPIFLSTLAKLGKANSVIALLFISLFFSFIALPPFLGFLSKFYVIFHLINDGFYESAIFLVAIGTFSAYYYLKLIKIVIADDSQVSRTTTFSFFPGAFLELELTLYFAIFFGLIFFTFYPDYLFLLCRVMVIKTFG